MLDKELDWNRLTKYARQIAIGKEVPYHKRDDLIQETLIDLHGKVSKYDRTRGATFYTWAYVVMNRFVGSTKRRWFQEVNRESREKQKLNLVNAIRRNRKRLKALLSPAPLRVACVLLIYGRISDAKIAKLAGVLSARSVSVHICQIRKIIKRLEN